MIDEEDGYITTEGTYPNITVYVHIPKSKIIVDTEPVPGPTIDLTVLHNEIDKRLDNMTINMISESDFNKLSKAEQEAPDMLYFITDPVDTFYDEEEKDCLVLPNNRPSDPIVGQCFFDTTIKLPLWFDGQDWIDALGNKR
jgi:hypothetical protein